MHGALQPQRWQMTVVKGCGETTRAGGPMRRSACAPDEDKGRGTLMVSQYEVQ